MDLVSFYQDSCQHQPPGGRASGDEYYGEDGRCFVANLTEVGYHGYG